MPAALTVADMMTTHLKVLHEDDSINAADWDMVVGEFRHMAVVDRDNRLVGLISDRDVLRSQSEGPTTVARLMTRDVHTVPPTMTALDAVEHMLRSKHGALPVVAADRTLLGIVTTTDFLELARRALAGHDIHQPHARA